MKWSLAVGLTSFFCSAAFSQDKTEYEVREDSKPYLARIEGAEFSIDPNLVDKVYEQSINSPSVAQSSASAAVELGIGQMIPSELVIVSNAYNTSYHDQSNGMLNARIQLLREFLHSESWAIEGFAALGYSQLQGIYEVVGPNGIRLKDNLSLEWAPIEIGMQALLRPVSSWQFELGPTFAVGADWLSQNGSLDGINRNFWSTHIAPGFLLSLLRDRNNKDSGFKGINLAAAQHQVLSSEQKFTGVNVVLSSRFEL